MSEPPSPPSRLSAAALLAIAAAGVIGAGAVALGAMAGHGLEAAAARLAGIASRYALVHAPVLIGAAFVFDRTEGWARRLAGLAMALLVFGIVGFSGSLALMAFDVALWGPQWGGLALIAAWVALAAAALVALFTRRAA